MCCQVSNDLFLAFLKCNYKAYLKLSGRESGTLTSYVKLQDSLMYKYRSRAKEQLLQSYKDDSVTVAPESLLDAMQHGYTTIVDSTEFTDGISTRYDALIQTSGRSSPSQAIYYPVCFVHSEKISRDDKLLLAFCGLALTRIQYKAPDSGVILYGDQFRKTKITLAPLFSEVENIINHILELHRANDHPTFCLNDHCSVCEFQEMCYETARKKNDLSLLRGLRKKDIAKLHEKGIFTVNQFSYTFRPRKQRKGMRNSVTIHNYALQARAIRDNNLYVAEKPVLPSVSTQIYLDIEGIPDTDVYYLIGLLITNHRNRVFHSLWADDADREQCNWNKFLEILKKMNAYTLLHYGKYELAFLRKMHKRYGGPVDLINEIESRSLDIFSLMRSRIYFPVFSNSLKSVASCVGFKWSMPHASGLESIAWYHDWKESQDVSIKERLIQYNKEDCLALEAVVGILNAISREDVQTDRSSFSNIVRTADLKPELPYRFQRQKFFFPELAQINECAYFDYQRDKIYLRGKKKSPTRSKRVYSVSTRNRTHKMNKCVEHPKPRVCDKCGVDDLRVRGYYKKDIIDLKFFRGGVKAWNERHIARKYRCEECGQVLYPEEYLTLGGPKRKGKARYGHNLNMWCVYNKVALGQSLGQIVSGLFDIFGMKFNRSLAVTAMRRGAELYRNTYEGLIDKVRSSDLIHADETWVSLCERGGGRGYVWVFANMETAVYKFSPTREATVPKDVLKSFQGVLVSDFYPVYESLECMHQKCLIHLMRDMNEDILKYPFDEEFKKIVHAFGILLRSIVETIDRYGLKKRYLNKHRKDVDRFYRLELNGEFQSERARKYQKRMLKHRSGLFLFLEHDGVPWNNNNGENAVKAFVMRRKLMGAFSRNGIDEYLILLSVFQTLRYRNISFLEFLLTGETDIERFSKKSHKSR